MHYTEHDDDRMIRVRASEWDRLEDRCKELEAELLTAQEGIEAWKAENAKTCARIRELEAELVKWKSAVEYFQSDNARLRDLLIKYGVWQVAPCCVCSYNGPGYYQPANHPCAARAKDLAEIGGV